jgi:hypothetical protein
MCPASEFYIARLALWPIGSTSKRNGRSSTDRKTRWQRSRETHIYRATITPRILSCAQRPYHYRNYACLRDHSIDAVRGHCLRRTRNRQQYSLLMLCPSDHVLAQVTAVSRLPKHRLRKLSSYTTSHMNTTWLRSLENRLDATSTMHRPVLSTTRSS